MSQKKMKLIPIFRLQIRFRDWHHSIQIYVGAFQSLYNMQLKYNQKHNPLTDTAGELYTLTIRASNFLCEIESRMRHLGIKKQYLNVTEMNQTVTFWKEPTHLEHHMMFTKVRFIEYLDDMQRLFEKKLLKLNRSENIVQKMFEGKLKKSNRTEINCALDRPKRGRKPANAQKRIHRKLNKNGKVKKPRFNQFKKRNPNNIRRNTIRLNNEVMNN